MEPDQADRDGADEAGEVWGLVLAEPLLLLGACTCGHDLADHLLGDGGTQCELASLQLCDCTHFRFAEPVAPPSQVLSPRPDRTGEWAAGLSAQAAPSEPAALSTGRRRRARPPSPRGATAAAPISSDAILAVLRWLRLTEATVGTPSRAHLSRIYGQLWPRRFVERVVAYLLAAGYAREDATGLHLADAGRQVLAEQAERERQRPRSPLRSVNPRRRSSSPTP